MKELNKIVNHIFISLGKPNIGPKKNELNSLKLRRSVFAIKDIGKGEKFSIKNLKVIRPGLGLEPKYFEKIIGKKATNNFETGTALKKKMVKGLK